MEERPLHIPVLLQEVVKAFEGIKLKVFFDGTMGAGGHAKALLEAHPEIEKYIGCDVDPKALEICKKELSPFKEKIELVQGNFSEIDRVLKEKKISCVNGFLIDIGVSSMQLDEGERGFSFSKEAPLDMRMDPRLKISAKDVVNRFTEKELGKIFKEFDVIFWKKAASVIDTYRKQHPIETTKQLADLLKKEMPFGKKGHLHPATLVFQALRIYVNGELEVLKKFMKKGIDALCEEGIGAVISFHSLEDRIVKEALLEIDQAPCPYGKKVKRLLVLTKKPIVPTESEVKKNPRSRSARLRVFQKRESECKN